MTDHLTRSLHEAADALPDRSPAAAQVRHGAERARRIRRAVGGATAASLVVLVVLVAIAVIAGSGGGRGTPANSPTTIPSQSSDSGGGVFTSDPLLTGAEWNDILDHAPTERTERTTATPRPLDCITDPHRLGAAQERSAAYLQPDRAAFDPALLEPARMNVYALWFTNAADAAATVTRLRQELVACQAQTRPNQPVTSFTLADWLMSVYPRIEQQFAGSIARKAGASGQDTKINAYSLTVSRAGRLVIVFESLNGWSDRPQNTVGLLMNHALAALSPQVARTR